MNTLSRTVTGIVMIVFGLGLIVVSPWLKYISLIYGVLLLVLGVWIFLNKSEDKIEKIKNTGGKK